tara:strand:- start:43 stop:219 length:177 start_codon:yes stop_codon:yes gene_type:complete
MMNCNEIQITQVTEMKGSTPIIKYLAVVDGTYKVYGETAADAYERARIFMEDGTDNIL